MVFKNVWFFSLPMVGSFFFAGTRMKQVCLRKALVGDGFCLNAKCAKFFRKVRKGVALGWERG